MYKQIKKIFLASIVVLCVGCASTQMTSFKDPDYEGSVFKRILVIVNTSDLEKQLYFETRMTKVFNGAGIFAKEGFKLFPPTRNMVATEKIELLKRDSIDAYISVYVGESGIEQIYIPPTGTSTKTEGSATVSGNQITYEEKSKTTVIGGYTISKPWAEFYAKLMDVSSGRTAWISSSFTGGSALSSFYTVINSFCDQILSQLVTDKLVKTVEQNELELSNLKIQNELELSDLKILKELELFKLERSPIDSSNQKYIYVLEKCKMVRMYLDYGSVLHVFLIGETPYYYLFLRDKNSTEGIKHVRKAIVQKLEDIK